MTTRKISEVLIAVYGLIYAVDRLEKILNDEARRREFKRNMRGKTLYTDFERLMFYDKDSALRFLNKIRDTIDRQGYATAADVYVMYDVPVTKYDTKIGWYAIYSDQVRIRKVSKHSYRLILPRPEYLY